MICELKERRFFKNPLISIKNIAYELGVNNPIILADFHQQS